MTAENNIGRYRFAVCQRGITAWMSAADDLLEQDTAFIDADFEILLGKAVGRLLEVIAPVVGPDNIYGLPKPSDYVFEPKSPLFSAIGIDFTPARATDLLIGLDDFGLLAAGEAASYYPANSLNSLLEDLHSQFPSLALYISTIERLLSIRSVRGMYERVAISSHGSDLTRFARVQSLWFEAKRSGVRPCANLLLFADDEQWDRRIAELELVVDRLRLNPRLQLPTEEVDRLEWGLSGASQLFDEFPYGESSGIGWTATFQAIDFRRNASSSQDRVPRFIRVRTNLAEIANEIFSNQNSPQVERIIRLTLGLPEGGEGLT